MPRDGAWAKAYAVGALGYFFGLIASIVFDLPTGAIIVWAMAVWESRFRFERGRPSAAAA